MMADLFTIPSVILITGALIIPLLARTLRLIFAALLPLAGLISVWNLDQPIANNWLGLDVIIMQATKVGVLFATIFLILTFFGIIFSWVGIKKYELTGALLCSAGAVGVCLCGDFISLFIFWELMAISSCLIIFSGDSLKSMQAGMRYINLHILGGVILLAGIIGLHIETGNIALRMLHTETWYTWLILSGFLLNAGAPPFSAWVSDAYPEASPWGTVFLSAYTTKTAVFALWVVFPGTFILIPIGIYMIFYGIIYALLENDIRRILTYSIINQVGFMIAAIGIGTELALNGSVAHASAHIIYKGLLLMSAGSVLYVTHKRKCTDLGGLYKGMRTTMICALIGAISISAVPFTSGYISKELITQSSQDLQLMLVWLAFITGSAGVFLHAGIKYPWFVFFQDKLDKSESTTDAPANMRIAMIAFSIICILLGVYPDLLYSALPYELNFSPYTFDHTIPHMQLLIASGIAFFIMLPLMKRTLTISLDFDWFYRKFGANLYSQTLRACRNCGQVLRIWSTNSLSRVLANLNHLHGEKGMFNRIAATNIYAVITLLLLVAYLALFYS